MIPRLQTDYWRFLIGWLMGVAGWGNVGWAAMLQSDVQSEVPAVRESQATDDSNVEGDLAGRYRKLQDLHREQLREIARKCDELEREELARFTRGWIPARDPARDYLFVLPHHRSLEYPPVEDQIGRYWRENLQRIHATYAEQLFGLAVEAVGEQRSSLAFRLLHECLFHDPGHQRAATILGVGDPRMEIRAYAYRNPDRLMPEGEVSRYESEHFELFTALDEKVARQSIAKFERWYVVWRQLFYDYWAHDSYLERRMTATEAPSRRSKKFRVVLYSDRDEYLTRLRSVGPGLEVSVGYYFHPEKTSFFYVGPDANETTWIHELTHQFMHETIPVSTRSQIQSGIWAAEGIAMYMESLMDFRTHVTVGGHDAERLNYCRHNYFRRGFFVPMDKLHGMGQRDFIESGEVAGLYSLSAAYCHYLMSFREQRPAFFQFLKLLHQGKNPQAYFERISEEISLDQGFKAYLKPDRQKLERSLLRPAAYRILYLGNSDINDQTLALLKTAVGLESLDLNGTEVSDGGIAELGDLTALRYLSLERTRITDRTLARIESWKTLEELDLTTTAVTDAGIRELAGLQKLQALWLGGTRVSDEAVGWLLDMASLQQLDVRKTEISEAGKKRLNARIRLVD